MGGGGKRRRGGGAGTVAGRRVDGGGGLGFHVCLYESSVRGPVAVGDTGLYYVLCDKGCLTADKAPRLSDRIRSA